MDKNTNTPQAKTSEPPYDPYHARWSYERLLLLQPHVNVEGLWNKGEWFYAVCPGLAKDLTTDGRPLQEWFERSCRVIACPIELVSSPPEGSVRVERRSTVDMARLDGAPLSRQEMDVNLALSLPQGFPDFGLKFDMAGPNANVYVARSLSATEQDQLESAYDGLRSPRKLNVQIEPERAMARGDFRNGHLANVALIPSRFLPRQISRRLKRAWEEDEDFWADHRVQLLATDLQDAKKLLPNPFTASGSRCLINAEIFPAGNLRTYLTLYRRVIIVPPPSTTSADTLSSLRVTEGELVELAARGRVQFALPMSLDLYRTSFLERIADAAPRALLFSRRLASASIAETRRRIPLLYPPFDTTERRRLLRALNAAASDPGVGGTAKAIGEELAHGWMSLEQSVHFNGAMSTFIHGTGSLLAAMFRHLTGRDLHLELLSVSRPVEWAAALGATVIPVDVEEYSEQAMSELCASLYSGIDGRRVPVAVGDVETVAEGLLALDNDASVLDVESAFSNSDIDRLGSMVRHMTSGTADPESMRAAVRDFNDRVRTYERRAGRLSRLDLVALSGAVASAGAYLLEMKGAGLVSLGAWLAKYLLVNADPSRDAGGRAIDWVRGVNAWTTGDVVLVSRLRRKLKG